MQTEQTFTATQRIALAKKCLGLISSIAIRGAESSDPAQVGYALEELTQVLFERTGSGQRLFEPIPADQIRNLDQLHSELDFVEGCSADLAMPAPPARIVPMRLS